MKAPQGQVYVCNLCGKMNKIIKEGCCLLHSKLCYEDSIAIGSDGRVISARVVYKKEKVNKNELH